MVWAEQKVQYNAVLKWRSHSESSYNLFKLFVVYRIANYVTDKYQKQASEGDKQHRRQFTIGPTICDEYAPPTLHPMCSTGEAVMRPETPFQTDTPAPRQKIPTADMRLKTNLSPM